MEKLRIVFMGTPDFAVESLKALVEGSYNIVGVVTMPDKPAGRGHKIQYSAVKEYALSKQLPLLQPEKLKDESFLQDLRLWNADLQIVVAFRMLPEVVWDMPKYGTFNLHASLLPQYRGAAPINWAVINGETKTGATTFFLTHEIDTGKIILQKEIAIDEEDDAGTIHDKLMILGAKMVTDTVDMIEADNVKLIPQEEMIVSELKPAPKIFKEDGELHPTTTVEKAHNFVRGLSPYPAAWINLAFPNQEKTAFKIFKTKPEIALHNEPCGSLLTDGKTYAKIACNNGFLHVLELQPPAKKRMKINDFLNGLK